MKRSSHLVTEFHQHFNNQIYNTFSLIYILYLNCKWAFNIWSDRERKIIYYTILPPGGARKFNYVTREEELEKNYII